MERTLAQLPRRWAKSAKLWQELLQDIRRTALALAWAVKDKLQCLYGEGQLALARRTDRNKRPGPSPDSIH